MPEGRAGLAPARAAVDAFYAGEAPLRLGVAVSGGSDSLALLHLLHDAGVGELHVVTVNHGLRPEAAGEALHVARVSEGLGLSHTVLSWEGWDGRGNLQDQARRSRYSMMAEWGLGRGLDAIALGHTMDDQAETMLMRLSRAAGVDGLSGMAPRLRRHGMRFDRPLLGVRREALRTFLAARGVRWADDPSNEDENFDRVRARRALAALGSLGLDVPALAGAAGNLREAREALERASRDAALAVARVMAGDVIFDRAALRALPPEIARRLMGAALIWVSGAEYPPRREPLAQALEARENMTLHGCQVLATAMTLRVIREPRAVAATVAPTDALWDGRWRLDGPHRPGLEIRALGEAVARCPGWREAGLPRASLLASPAVWEGDDLVAAPVAGLARGWSAIAPDLTHFAASLVSH